MLCLPKDQIEATVSLVRSLQNHSAKQTLLLSKAGGVDLIESDVRHAAAKLEKVSDLNIFAQHIFALATRTRTHAHTCAHKRTQTHTCAHMRTQTHTNAHMRTQTQSGV